MPSKPTRSTYPGPSGIRIKVHRTNNLERRVREAKLVREIARRSAELWEPFRSSAADRMLRACF